MYQEKSNAELQAILTELKSDYANIKKAGLKLDMSRGKPSPEQLDISSDLLDVMNRGSDFIAEDGSDCRNYGSLDGIPEAKRLMASLLEVEPSETFIGSGSSLNLMHDLISFCWLHPLPGCDKPWSAQGEVRFLCPVPGYDRHFAVTDHFGIQNIPVPMTSTGPDMDEVERLIANDPAIKGIWCVPKYSNPTGVTYSDETVRRLAALKPAAKDFRIFWDNAYAVHDLYEQKRDTLLPFLPALKNAGNDNLAFLFSSFAKVTFGGGGISAVGASAENMGFIKKHMSLQTINYDKVNQLRHTRYFSGGIADILTHMAKHRAILAPKFAVVQQVLERELSGLGIADWTTPLGGYFISLNTPEGCAKRIVELCKEAGVILTGAGATFPYGKDPDDRNIRIAPSYPTVEELRQASELLCLCVKIASIEARLA